MATNNQPVKFVYVDQTGSLPEVKDPDTVYFLKSAQQLYVGDRLIADHTAAINFQGSVNSVSDLPESAESGSAYVVLDSGIYIYDSSEWSRVSSSVPSVDASLSISGCAADAKSTGDSIIRSLEILADVEDESTFSSDKNSGQYFVYDHKLFKVLRNIESGDEISVDQNCSQVSVSSEIQFSSMFESFEYSGNYESFEIDSAKTGQSQLNSYTTDGVTYQTALYRLGYRAKTSGQFSGSTHYAVNHVFPLNTVSKSVEPDYISVVLEDDPNMPDDYLLCRVQYVNDSGTYILPDIQSGNQFIFINDHVSTGNLYVSIGRWTSDSMTQEIADNRIAYCDSKVHVKLHYKKPCCNSLGRTASSNLFVYNSDFDYAVSGVPGVERSPMIILCHGLSSTISSSTWGSSPDMITLVKSFNSAGYFVLDVGRVTSYDWCNPSLIMKYVAAVNDCANKYNVYPKYIFGESMGSLIALWLSKYYNVKATVIGGPRLDFSARYQQYVDNSDTEALQTIDTNLGFSSGFDKLLAAPWALTEAIAVTPSEDTINTTQLPPTLCLFGDSDDSYYGQSIDIARINELQRGGNVVEVKHYSSDHHGVCYLTAGTSLQDTLDWFNLWK